MQGAERRVHGKAAGFRVHCKVQTGPHTLSALPEYLSPKPETPFRHLVVAILVALLDVDIPVGAGQAEVEPKTSMKAS